MNTKEKQTAEQAGQTRCIRCGTCCEKGGPALHEDDLDLVLNKRISPENLYTIRRAELVYDNVNGGLIKIGREIVKIRSAENTRACIYYDDRQKACSIYEIRPIECRVMACWDTTAAEALYNVNRLTRQSLFGSVDWLADLIRTHEEKCGYERISELAEKRRRKEAGAVETLLEAVRYDVELRRTVQEKTGMEEDLMDLVFGRPLSQTIPAQFGIKLVRTT
ncbi:MAG: YkgJ family cysteine cluster protein [Desulfobacteraceae bacterium]|nr:YkgJ family cysteine cluster protein [Desulfobacteraceae bacterium]